MKIMLVGRKFGGVAGGVERMAILLINKMIERGHEMSLLTWDQRRANSHFELDKNATWYKLDLGDPLQKASWKLRIKRQLRIREIISDDAPDIVLAFQHGAFLAVRTAVLGLGIAVIAAERNAPQRFNFLPAGKWRGLIFLTFLLARKVIVQFDSYRAHYSSYLQNRIVVIPNPVTPAKDGASSNRQSDFRKTLLFVGHLAYQKNPEVLLRAFAELASDFPDWDLDIVGQGEYRIRLEKIVATLNIKDQVRFLGKTTQIENMYQKAHLFCLPSLWEGFPNALAEALAYSLPAVGFAECAGVNELIRNGQNGLLAEGNGDPRHLATSLRKLMKSAELREELGRGAVKSIEDYSEKRIFNQWEELMMNIHYER